MIRVKISDEEISVDGHAGYADPGKDIVCAAVSALAQAAVYTIAVYDADAQVDAESGHLFLKFSKHDNYTEGVIDSLKMGVLAVENDYGDFVKVTCV